MNLLSNYFSCICYSFFKMNENLKQNIKITLNEVVLTSFSQKKNHFLNHFFPKQIHTKKNQLFFKLLKINLLSCRISIISYFFYNNL
jgi:hypothetical protein